MNTYKTIRFSVDAALLRELGERLVGRPHIALAELVKNSYDADATTCTLVFEDDAIEVRDNGVGMSERDFSRFWMRVGTTHKQHENITRLNRPVTGSKGIGRLAVQFLANRLELWTATPATPQRILHAKVDWSAALRKDTLIEAGAKFRMEPRGRTSLTHDHGTRIRLEDLNQDWDAATIRALAREIWVLQPPPNSFEDDDAADQKFEVNIDGLPPEEQQVFSEQMTAALENWDAIISGHVKNGRQSGKAHVKVEFRDGEVFEESFAIPNSTLDQVRFSIRVFNLAGRQPRGISVGDAREYLAKFGGVRVYDSGFRLPYYGIEQDWLGLEIDHSHRLMVSKLLPEQLRVPGGMQELPTQTRLYGVVRVNTAREQKSADPKALRSGEYLKIQVTRDRLVDNKAYQDLRYVIRWAIDFYATRVRVRRLRDLQFPQGTGQALAESMGRLRTVLAENRQYMPARVYAALEVEAEALEEAEELRNRAARAEQMLLAALATAGMAAIAIEHEVGKELSALRVQVDVMRTLARDLRDERLKTLADRIQAWTERVVAARKLFSPLMSEADRQTYAKLRARHVLERVAESMKPLMRGAQFNLDGVPESLRLPLGTMAGWQAVFQNLFTNSLNAMIDSTERRIACFGGLQGRRGTAYIEVCDTGVGVDLATADELFKPFVRKLSISTRRQALGLGGVGIGLTIVRIVAETMDCDVAFVPPPPPYNTAVKTSWSVKDV
jgi:signal transduction histidine kinase